LHWNISSDDFHRTEENSDNSYNVIAELRIEPTPDLDGTTITCSAFITEENYMETSLPSHRISVKCMLH